MIKKMLSLLLVLLISAFLASCFPWDDDTDEPDGQALYNQNCRSCHGINGTRNGDLRDMTVDELVSLLPHYNVTSDDIGGTEGAEAIVDYIADGDDGGDDDSGDELDGQDLYSENCQSCHGDNGTRNGDLSDMTVDELMDLLPHYNVTSDDIGGTEGAEAIVDYIADDTDDSGDDDSGDELDGQELYSKNCQSCHGTSGTQNGDLRNMTVDQLMGLLPHFNVTSSDIGGTEGAEAIVDYIAN